MDKKEFEIEINRFNDVSFYNEADFDILLIKLKDLAEKDILTKNYVFRGINKVEEFFPKIIRRKMGLVEDKLLTDLENKGQYLISQNNFLDFLTTAQHYGLPTRLVDFTYNPYIALFFAFYEQKKGGDSEYYYLMYCNLLDNLSFINLLQMK